MVVYPLTKEELSTILRFDPDLLSWIPESDWLEQQEGYWMVREQTFVQLSHPFSIGGEHFPANVSFMIGRIRYSAGKSERDELVQLRSYVLFWEGALESGISPLPDYGGRTPYNPMSN